MTKISLRIIPLILQKEGGDDAISIILREASQLELH